MNDDNGFWMALLIATIMISTIGICVGLDRVCDAIREQTKVLSHYNLIQAPEHVESVVLFDQDEP